MNKSTKFRQQVSAHKTRIVGLKNHPFIIPVVTFLVLFFAGLVGFVGFSGTTVGAADSRIVHIYVDGKMQTLPTRAPTVKDLVTRLNIQLHNEDVIEPALDTKILEDDFHINIYRARPVTIVDGGKTITALSAAQSPQSVARQAGVPLNPEDKVVVSQPGNVLSEGVIGQKVVVQRATPIAANIYGVQVNTRTLAKTVGDFIKDRKIIMEPGDTTQPSLDTPITPSMQLFILAKGKQIATTEEEIPMPLETIDDPNLLQGKTEIRQAGSPGKKIVTYEIQTVDGKEVGRRHIQEIIAANATKQIVVRGTKVVTITGTKADWMAAAGISPSDFVYVDFIMSHESGWRPNAVSANRCVGLGQRCNAQILISACPNWETDPVCQLRHFSQYSSRYGGWAGAYSAWQAQHWW